MKPRKVVMLPLFGLVLGIGGSAPAIPCYRVIPRVDAGRDERQEWFDPARGEAPLTHYRTFTSRTIGGEVSYLIYTPPRYDEETDRRYPVVYWLHGRGAGPRSGAVFAWRLDKAIKSGRVPPMIAVLVNGRRASMYCDSWDGREPVESVLMDDLIPHVDATYRTVARREGRAIAGHSMGGFGALRLALRYPERFASVTCLGAALYEDADHLAARRPEVFRDVFGGRPERFEAQSPWTLLDRNAGSVRGRLQIRLLIGDRDQFLDENRRFHEWLLRRRIPHEFLVLRSFDHDYAPICSKLGAGTFRFAGKDFDRPGKPGPDDRGPSPGPHRRPHARSGREMLAVENPSRPGN